MHFLIVLTAISYMEWRYVFPSNQERGGVSIEFFLGQVLYHMAVLHLEKEKLRLD